ncbi:hypothetical protein BD626DRAFT_31949 [Schizophyllum amplum]|uniref:F-box domain-containing protein n=1 Tax=Schizophyllum amplum TaxID=97359 RepID=A0A550D0U2_9AGAR|nr:hypothetical protein BD626DRAFT_31949 [Auriculariopsis ampla]
MEETLTGDQRTCICPRNHTGAFHNTEEAVPPCLARISALLEGASSLASMERLRNGPFPAIEDVALFHAYAQNLSDEIEHIGAQRARILRDADRQLEIIRSTVAPIRRLPSELLSEVFEIVVCSQPPYERTFAARILAAVCAIWRATALGTANLWTCVDLSLATCKTVEALLDMHADLSNGLLLHVCQRPGTDVDEQMRCLLALPSKYTELVEQISFCGDELTLPVRKVPDLSSLVRAKLSIYGQDASRALVSLRRARALRSLSIHLEHNCEVRSGLSMPIPSYLTELEIIDNGAQWSYHAISSVLEGCAASLQRLVLSTEIGFGVRWEGARIDFPALRRVDLHYGAHYLLSRVEAPALENVVLREAHNPFASLRRIVEHSPPPIRTLDLLYADTSDDRNNRQFEECLQRLEALTGYSVVDLDDDYPNIRFDLAYKTCSKTQQPIIPALTSLHLRYNGKVYYALVELDAYLRDSPPGPEPQSSPMPSEPRIRAGEMIEAN